jgi:hypothetical protein
MVEKSRDRLKKDMNIVDIIKKLRYQQVMMNSTNVQSESRRLKLAHTFQSVIDIDEDEKLQIHAKNRRVPLGESEFLGMEIEPNIEFQVLNHGVPVETNVVVYEMEYERP